MEETKWFEPYFKHLDRTSLERLTVATFSMYDEDEQVQLLETSMQAQIARAETASNKARVDIARLREIGAK